MRQHVQTNSTYTINALKVYGDVFCLKTFHSWWEFSYDFGTITEVSPYRVEKKEKKIGQLSLTGLDECTRPALRDFPAVELPIWKIFKNIFFFFVTTIPWWIANSDSRIIPVY